MGDSVMAAKKAVKKAVKMAPKSLFVMGEINGCLYNDVGRPSIEQALDVANLVPGDEFIAYELVPLGTFKFKSEMVKV